MTTDTTRRQYLRTIGATGVAALTLPVAGCSAPSDGSDGSDGGDGSDTVTVDMTDELTFDPESIEVSAGTTVRWTTVGSVGHTVTAYDDGIPDGAVYFASGGFDSESAARDGYPQDGNVAEGESYEHTFETPGEYEYFCIPHELNGMVGTVTVT